MGRWARSRGHGLFLVLGLGIAGAVGSGGAAAQPVDLNGVRPQVINGVAVSGVDLEARGLIHVNGGSCSGVLLDNSWVLTASHCLTPAQTISPATVTVEARWATNQTRTADRIYREWELKPTGDPEIAERLDLALIHAQTPFQVNGSTTGYSRALSTRRADQMVGRSIEVFGQGMEREAFMQAGTPMGATFTNTFRSGTFTVSRVDGAIRFWYPRNDAGQMVGGGDSGGPSFDGDEVAGVHVLCHTRCLQAGLCTAADPWTFVSRVEECADAPANQGRGIVAFAMSDPAWNPTMAYQDITSGEVTANVPNVDNTHERTIWPAVQEGMFRYCERRGFVAAPARYGDHPEDAKVLCLGAGAARVLRMTADDLRALGAGTDVQALSFADATAAATRFCAARVPDSVGGFPGGVRHSTTDRTDDIVCVLDANADRKMQRSDQVRDVAAMSPADQRRRGDLLCRSRGYATGGFVTGVTSGADIQLTCFGAQDATARLLEQGANFGGVPDEVLSHRRAFYALNIDEPLVAPPGAAIDTQLSFAGCHGLLTVVRRGGGCPVEAAYEQWGYDPASKRILHLDSGKCLNVSGASPSPGAPIILYPCSGAANERWEIQYPGTSAVWQIRSVASGLCLHAQPGERSGPSVVRDPASGRPLLSGDTLRLPTPARLTQMPCDGSDAQKFSNVDADWYRRNGPR